MYAEVAVDFPSGVAKTYTYSVPAHLALAPGHLVLVPFGARTLPGLVFSLTSTTSVEQPREVGRLLSSEPLLSSVQLDLARWLSRRYLGPLYEAASLLLAPGAEPRTKTFYQVTANPSPRTLASLSSEETRVYSFLAERGRVSLDTVKRALPRP
ncbi:MAG: hypothetical protein Q8P59_10095, partial [Dehalococcoidia bacterium]|nr:hypothetical protein [Dehalococcoidia bacterium]